MLVGDFSKGQEKCESQEPLT